MLIESVDQGSPAAAAGLVAGDILIEAGGHPLVAGKPLPPMDPTLPLVVVRRGQPRVLNNLPPGRAGAAMAFGDLPRLQAAPAAATAQTFATGAAGGEAISISQVGEHVTVQYDSPQCPDGPVRFSGSMQQIEQQLGETALPKSVRENIRRQLGLPAEQAQ